MACDKAVLNSNIIIILYMNIMFIIGCAYSRTFEYAVILPQRVRVGLRIHIKSLEKNSAAPDMQDKIGKVGNTPFYLG